MEWFWWIIFSVVLWDLARRWQQSRPEAVLNRLEALAYAEHRTIVEDARAGLKLYEENREKKSYLMGKARNDEMIKLCSERLAKILAMGDKFTRLKARREHVPAKEKLSFYQDWYSYNTALNRLKMLGRQLEY